MNFIQKKLIAILLLLVITSCGFHLRGMTEISFKTISLEGKELSLTKNLKKILNTNKVAIVSSTENPELRVELLSEESEKRILSLSGQGLVREFEIFYRVRYRIKTSDSEIWSQENIIETLTVIQILLVKKRKKGSLTKLCVLKPSQVYLIKFKLLKNN
jgi:LPS-assembly lipoprotein